MALALDPMFQEFFHAFSARSNVSVIFSMFLALDLMIQEFFQCFWRRIQCFRGFSNVSGARPNVSAIFLVAKKSRPEERRAERASSGEALADAVREQTAPRFELEPAP
jgi:hypothetical protein